ncbi:MAG TPA: DUF4307 domain-containing protein [Propionibacteriaceae bacterium]|nr:DUF4307 domain-containing protein [Propionibacteriaceae bacterium]
MSIEQTPSGEPEAAEQTAAAAGRAPVRGPRTPEERARIAARYPRPRRWPAVVLGVAFALLLGSWTLWTAVWHANPPVSAQVLSFEVVSDSEVRVVLHVDRPDPSIPGVCTVITQAQNYQQVGELDAQIAPGTVRLTDITVTVRTIARATSASLQGCHARP